MPKLKLKWPMVLEFRLGRDQKGRPEWQSRFKDDGKSYLAVPHGSESLLKPNQENRVFECELVMPLHNTHGRKYRVLLVNLKRPAQHPVKH